VAGAGGLGGKDERLAAPGDGRRRVGARFDDADHRYIDCRFHVIERQGRGRVAADDQQIDAARREEARGRRGVARHELLRLGAVGKTRRVAEENIVGIGYQPRNGPQHGKPADAGVKDSDGGTMGVGSHLNQCSAKAGSVGKCTPHPPPRLRIGRRFPEFDSISLRIGEPAEAAVLVALAVGVHHHSGG